MENSKISKMLKVQAIAMVIMLAIQYGLGMAVNLFSKFPENANAGQLWEYAWSQFSITSHIVVGILLLVGAIVFVIRSIVAKNKTWIVFSVIGLVTIFIAGGSGATFITTQNDIYSYVMSLSFIVALLSYVGGVVYSK